MSADNPYFGQTNAKIEAERLEIQAGGFNPHTHAFLSSLDLPVVDQALELAAGRGDCTPMLAEHARSVIATDSNDSSAIKVGNAAKLFGVEDKVSFRQMDAMNLDFPDGTFGLGYARLLLTNLPKAIHPQVIGGLARVVKTGGHVVFEELATDEGWKTDGGQSLHLKALVDAVNEARKRMKMSNKTGAKLKNALTAQGLKVVTSNSYIVEKPANDSFNKVHHMFMGLYAPHLVTTGVLDQKKVDIHLAGLQEDFANNPNMMVKAPKMYQIAAIKTD